MLLGISLASTPEVADNCSTPMNAITGSMNVHQATSNSLEESAAISMCSQKRSTWKSFGSMRIRWWTSSPITTATSNPSHILACSRKFHVVVASSSQVTYRSCYRNKLPMSLSHSKTSFPAILWSKLLFGGDAKRGLQHRWVQLDHISSGHGIGDHRLELARQALAPPPPSFSPLGRVEE